MFGKNASKRSNNRPPYTGTSGRISAADLQPHSSSAYVVDPPHIDNPFVEPRRERAEKPDKKRRKPDLPSQVKLAQAPKLARDSRWDQGERLLEMYANSNSKDPFADWFEYLGLPYYSKRIPRESQSARPPAARLGATSCETFRSDDRGQYSGLNTLLFPSGSNDDASTSQMKVDSKPTASASSLTSNQMTSYLRWSFGYPEGTDPKPKNLESQDPKGSESAGESTKPKPLNLCDPWYDATSTIALHDIKIAVVRPIDSDSKSPLEIHRKITQRLNGREQRQLLDETNNNPKLHLLDSWNAAMDPKKPEPIFYPIPLGLARYITNIELRVPEDHVVDVQSAGSVHSDEGEVQQLSLYQMSENAHAMSNPPEASQSSHWPVFQTIRRRFDPLSPPKTVAEFHAMFPFNDKDSDVSKKSTAYAMFNAAKVLNRPWERCRAIEAMKSRISSIDERDTVIQWISEKDMRDKDRRGEIGSTTVNWDTTNPLQFEPFIIEKFLAFPGCPVEASSEGRVEKEVGNLVINIIAGTGFRDRDNCQLHFTGPLTVVGSHPSPDSFVRASTEGLPGWPEDTLPVLFAGECKPQKTYHNVRTRVQLATAFHATLILLILYYLDTRKTTIATLSDWLFLYGIEYTEHGVMIHAHHPKYHFYPAPSKSGEWRLVGTLLSEDYSKAFLQGVDPRVRVRLLAVLFRIRRHVIFILDQLKAWDRGGKVASVLSEQKRKEKRKETGGVAIWRDRIASNMEN